MVPGVYRLTHVNDEPIPPHQALPVAVGDSIRMGTTTLRVARMER